jgi:hypothetical protein
MPESNPCGGCGAQTSAERCIGCFHDFGDAGSAWVRRPTRADNADALLREGLALMARCQAIPSVGTTPTAGQTEDAINQWAEKVRQHIGEDK